MQIPETTMTDWSFWHRAFYIFFPRFLIPLFLSSFFQFEVHNKNHLYNFPEGTPVIYCINHRSHLDGFIAGSAVVVPRGPRTRIALMGAGNIMQENWLFRLLPYFGAFPIYSEKSEFALNFAVKLLKQGIGIVIAPQGKRIIGTPYHDYFNLAKEGKTGVGRLILSLNGKIPVIPIYIPSIFQGLDLIFLFHSLLLFFGMSILVRMDGKTQILIFSRLHEKLLIRLWLKSEIR